MMAAGAMSQAHLKERCMGREILPSEATSYAFVLRNQIINLLDPSGIIPASIQTDRAR